MARTKSRTRKIRSGSTLDALVNARTQVQAHQAYTRAITNGWTDAQIDRHVGASRGRWTNVRVAEILAYSPEAKAQLVAFWTKSPWTSREPLRAGDVVQFDGQGGAKVIRR